MITETKSPSEITEAQVVAFLEARLVELRAKFPKGYVTIRVNAAQYLNALPTKVAFQIGASGLAKDYTGATIAEALQKFAAESPEKIAAEKRIAAAKLLAEAEALAPTAATLEAATKGGQ